MKRNMELVREILIQTEAYAYGKGSVDLNIDDFPEEDVSYNVKILGEAGLLHAVNLSTGMTFCWRPTSLTWQGHEFLDSVRNDTVWHRTKEIIAEKGGAIPFAVLQQIVLKLV